MTWFTDHWDPKTVCRKWSVTIQVLALSQPSHIFKVTISWVSCLCLLPHACMHVCLWLFSAPWVVVCSIFWWATHTVTLSPMIILHLRSCNIKQWPHTVVSFAFLLLLFFYVFLYLTARLPDFYLWQQSKKTCFSHLICIFLLLSLLIRPLSVVI